MNKKKRVVVAIVAVALILVTIAFYLPFVMLRINAQQAFEKNVRIQSELDELTAAEALKDAWDAGYAQDTGVITGMHDFEDITVVLADGQMAKLSILVEVEFGGADMASPSQDDQVRILEEIGVELSNNIEPIKAKIKEIAAGITSAELLSAEGKAKFSADIVAVINSIIDTTDGKAKQIFFSEFVVTSR